MAYPPPSFHKRRTLEIIIDSCSVGSKQLRAVERIIDFMKHAEPPVYDNYRIVLPVQIGAELRQRIFPAFIRAELSLPPEVFSDPVQPQEKAKRPSGLRRFFQTHLDHVVIAETPISQAYKLKYAEHACVTLFEHPSLGEAVVAEAHRLCDRYGEGALKSELDLPALHDLCWQLATIREQERGQHQIKLDEIQTFYGQKPGNMPVDIARAGERAEVANLARHQAAIESTLTPAQRYLFQALYSERALHDRCVDAKFKQFRTDKGERAVESYLFNKRRKPDAGVVSFVVSNDKGSRNGIDALRQESKNKVLVVSNRGLTQAVELLTNDAKFSKACEGLTLTRPVPNTVQERYRRDPLNARHQAIREGEDQHPPSKTKLNETTEFEWARRLAEVLRYGDWRKLYRHTLAEVDTYKPLATSSPGSFSHLSHFG